MPLVGTGFAWNHGDIQPEIARTFIGIVGPGVRNLGVTEPRDFFTDPVNLRPTMNEQAKRLIGEGQELLERAGACVAEPEECGE